MHIFIPLTTTTLIVIYTPKPLLCGSRSGKSGCSNDGEFVLCGGESKVQQKE